MKYLNYMYLNIQSSLKKLNLACNHKKVTQFISLIFSYNLFFILEIVFTKGEYPYPINILIAVISAFILYIILINKRVRQKITPNTKHYSSGLRILFRLHIILSILTFFYLTFIKYNVF